MASLAQWSQGPFCADTHHHQMCASLPIVPAQLPALQGYAAPSARPTTCIGADSPINLLIIILCSFFMFLRISAYCGPGPNCNPVPHVGPGGPKCIYAYDSDSFVESGVHRVATAPLENVAMGFCLSRHGLVQKEKSKFLECVFPNWRNTQDEHN